ncbi:MAG: oligosaccharide flippase family protein [Proteobacteria bacterium]|nr:oligosaccharide flippase family protein [Desulfobulbaceae bacterium]MBU4154124.1 oligosaccharide flippase family protein [Pseudomonadota bacterium]
MKMPAFFSQFNASSDKTILVRLLKNSAYLLSGNTIGDLFTMAALALTARKLGPELFGTFVLIQTYALIMTQMLNFQSWQALVKFGAEKLEHKKDDEFMEVVSLCFLLDVMVAILATLLALLLVKNVASWYGWDQTTATMASVYSLTILFSVTDTAIGILQISNKFKLLALHNTLVALFKLSCVLAAFFFQGELWVFLFIWMASGAVATLLILGMGWKVLAARFKPTIRLNSLKPALTNNKGIVAFLATTNLHSSIRLTSRELDVMIIGALLGPASAGIIKIVKQIASLFTRITNPLNDAIYPELTTLWAAKEIDKLQTLIRQSCVIAAIPSLIGWLGFIVIGKPLIIFFWGAPYAPVFPIAVIYTLAVLIALITFSFHPLMLAMGKAGQSLLIVTVSSVAYFLLLIPLINRIDVLGVAVAYCLFYIIWSLLMAGRLSYHLRQAQQCDQELAVDRKKIVP